jgi:CHAT domain-containing protein
VAAVEDLLHGARLEPLPSTRVEVERLRALYGESAAVYVGAEATEERAKALRAETSIVHFASHALLDESFPLESALALSIPADSGTARENGLLQAWEVFEAVRLDADLVTLSACETALGREVVGEGMLGLTRAFHYAGARSVLASLWRIDDESTAELMAKFYAGMRAGLAKDEALRRAQLSLLREPLTVERDGVRVERNVSAPLYWAAFQLFGDWR